MNKYSDLSARNEKYNLNEFGKSLSPRGSESQITLPKLYRGISEYCWSPEPKMHPNHVRSTDSLFGISPLSQNENKALKKMSLHFFSSPDNLKLPSHLSKSPTQKDYIEILSQIESVICDKAKNRYILLSDDEPLYHVQSGNLPSFFKIEIQGKKCPLYVNIKKFQGHPIVYSSFSEIHPRPAVFDKVYYKTFFEINDKGYYEFKSRNVYLGVFCDTDCRYKIEIAFGKFLNCNEIKKQLTLQELSIEEKAPPKLSPIPVKPSKNFVESNKDVQKILESLKPRDPQTVRELDLKRAEIVKRKKKLQREKKQRAIENLNKQEIIGREDKSQADSLKQESLVSVKKSLLCISFILSSFFSVKKLITENRKKKLERILYRQKVARVQKFLRKTLPAPDIIPLIAANRSLTLFKHTLQVYFKKSAEEQIASYFSSCSQSTPLLHQIGIFSQKILKIQKSFRSYLVLKKARIAQLQELWKSCLSKLKSRKSLKIPNNTLISAKITAHILSEHYLFAVSLFYSSLSSPIFKTSCESPVFNFVPSEAVMQQMVLNSLKLKPDNK